MSILNIFAGLPAKLISFLLAPLTFLIVLVGLLASEKHHTYRTTKDYEVVIHLSMHISDLIHELQIERGLSAGFLGSKDPIFRHRMENKRIDVQEKMDNIDSFFDIANFGVYEKQLQERVLLLSEKLEEIANIRNYVNAGTVSVVDTIDLYSKINRSLLDTIAIVSTLSKDINIARISSTFFTFLHLKESASIERAILANTFASDQFVPELHYKLPIFQGEWNAHSVLFLSLSTPVVRDLFTEIQSSPESYEVNRLRYLALKHEKNGGFGVDPIQWFELATQRIELLQSMEKKFKDKLLSTTTEVYIINRNNFLLYGFGSIVLLATAFALFFAIIYSARNLQLTQKVNEGKLVEKRLRKQAHMLDNLNWGGVGYDGIQKRSSESDRRNNDRRER